MKIIELGKTGEFISCAGLGTMYFGSKIDRSTSFDILDYYTSTGGSLLDSANKYASWVPGFHGGESESVIGQWIKARNNRNQLFITSKIGFSYESVPRSLKKEVIYSECEKSLKRMGVEMIDLYFAHTFDPDTSVEESMEAFYTLIKQGKIRFAGASNHDAYQVYKANMAANKIGWEGFCCLQQRHTYFEPSFWSDFGTQLLLTPEQQRFCKLEKLTIMAYSPLLSGAYIHNNSSLPLEYHSVINEEKRERLHKIAKELNISANAVVLAWMIQGTPPVIPLIAGSSLPQMKENMQFLTNKLSAEHIKELNQKISEPRIYS